MNKDAIEAQTIGAVAETFNNIRQEELQSILNEITTANNVALSAQDLHFAEALKRIDSIQNFIENPEGILGSNQTKHGEIAEQVEVGITNARAVLNSLADRATADPGIVGRTVNAPADYLVDNQQVQSKFINSELNTLKHVFEHLQKYEDIGFARGDGSYYHIPKDQFNNIMKIIEDGTLDDRSQKSINAILREIQNIENVSGQKFTDIVKAAQTNYKDVQLGKIQDTIDNYRTSISNDNKQIIDDINSRVEKDNIIAIDGHQPNLGEAAKVAAIGAAVSAGMTLAINIYKKNKQGIKISDFTVEDWQEIGLDTGKKAVKGGITGGAVYGLTNLTNMSAPVASGLVSATFGMSSLLKDYRRGEMTFNELIENSEILCMDTGVVTLGSMIGQAIIPVPVVGAVVGSIVSNIIYDLAKDIFEEKELELLNEYHNRYKEQISELENEIHDYVKGILNKYQKLGGILNMAFDTDINYEIRFLYSQQLALELGVDPVEVLMTERDINDYFLN